MSLGMSSKHKANRMKRGSIAFAMLSIIALWAPLSEASSQAESQPPTRGSFITVDPQPEEGARHRGGDAFQNQRLKHLEEAVLRLQEEMVHIRQQQTQLQESAATAAHKEKAAKSQWSCSVSGPKRVTYYGKGVTLMEAKTTAKKACTAIHKFGCYDSGLCEQAMSH